MSSLPASFLFLAFCAFAVALSCECGRVRRMRQLNQGHCKSGPKKVP